MKKNIKKAGMIGLVGVMATTAIPTYVYNNINVEAARNHNGVCEIETKNGEFNFNVNGTVSRKKLDLMIILDTSSSMVENFGRALSGARAMVESLEDDDLVTFAHYNTNMTNSYNNGVKDSFRGNLTKKLTKKEALDYLTKAATYTVRPAGVQYEDFIKHMESQMSGVYADKGENVDFQNIFMKNHKDGDTISVIQFTDGWGSSEDIDQDFAKWAKEKAKTFMTVSYQNNSGANGGPTSYSIEKMKAIGHPNIYDERVTPIDHDKIVKQFKNTGTEVLSPDVTIDVKPEQGLTLKEVKLVGLDGKEEMLSITNSSVNVVKKALKDGKWTVKVKAEGLVHETKKVRATASISGKEVGKTELLFEGCQDLVAGTKEEKENVNIPFETKYEDTDTLPAGETKVKQEGVVGTKEIKRVWKTINGEKQGNPTVTESIIKQKVDKIILRGTQQKKTVYYRILDAAGKVIKDNTKVSDGYKGVKYSVTKPTLAGYEIEFKAGMQETGTLEGKDIIVDYVAYKLGQGVKARYVDETGVELKGEMLVQKAGLRNGTKYSVAPEPVLEKGGLKYVYKELKQGSAPASGVVSDNEQVVTFVYKKAEGKAVKAEFLKKDTAIKLLEDLIIKPAGTQVGTPWASTHKNELVKDHLVYVIDGKVPVEQGKVTETEQVLKYNYVPKLGKGVNVKYMYNNEELKPTFNLIKDGLQVGTAWGTVRVNEIEKDGLVYVLDVQSLPVESGRVTDYVQEVVYKYVPKIGQLVKVKYMSGDKEISDPEVVIEGKQVGTRYEKEVVREITKDNVLYRFVGLEKLDETKVVNTEVKKGEESKVNEPKVETPKNEKPKVETLKANKEEVKLVTDEVKKDEPKVEKPKESVMDFDSKSEINGMRFSGLVNNHEQVYVAKYEMIKSKTVAVTFVDEDGKELQSKVDLVKEDQQVGTEFTYEPKEIEKDGIKYIIEKITFLGKDVKEIKGKSTEEAMLYTVHYKKVPDKKLPLRKTGSEGTNAAIAFGMMLLGALGFRRYKAK